MTAGESNGRLDDDDYPGYTMGRAAEILGTTQGFLRALGEAALITPLRSEGGHRRYSQRPSASTPSTAAPPKPRTRQPNSETTPGPPEVDDQLDVVILDTESARFIVRAR